MRKLISRSSRTLLLTLAGLGLVVLFARSVKRYQRQQVHPWILVGPTTDPDDVVLPPDLAGRVRGIQMIYALGNDPALWSEGSSYGSNVHAYAQNLLPRVARDILAALQRGINTNY